MILFDRQQDLTGEEGIFLRLSKMQQLMIDDLLDCSNVWLLHQHLFEDYRPTQHGGNRLLWEVLAHRNLHRFRHN